MPKTGCFGALRDSGAPTIYSSLRQWSLSESQQLNEYGASNTGCAKGRSPGILSWNGSAQAYGAVPLFMPGDAFDFEGYTAPDNGLAGGNGHLYSGPACVRQVQINWDFTNGALIWHQVDFEANGALTSFPNGTAVQDNSNFINLNSCDGKFEVSDEDGATFHEIENITTAQLTILANNQKFANSSTGCTEGVLKGQIDWTLTLNLQDNVFPVPSADPKTTGQNVQIRAYADADSYFLLKFGIVGEHTNLVVDIENDTIIGYTWNARMQPIDSAGNIGGIFLPEFGGDEGTLPTAWWGS